MNDPFRYEFERLGGERLRISLYGNVEGPELDGIASFVDHQLETLARGHEVLFDLTGVIRCDPQACRVLARVQRRLGAHGCRTAYLVKRPRIRGVAWWIVHASKDSAAMPAETMDVAEKWLAGDRERLDELEARTDRAAEHASAARTQEPAER